MKAALRTLAAAVTLAAIAVALRFTVFAPKPVPVVVARVTRGPVEETLTNTRAGSVRARRRAKLSPEVGGRVASLPFHEGDRVRKGDVLVGLDDSLQRASLELAERDLAAATAQNREACLAAERAERERDRTAKLAEDGIASRDLLDQTETSARRARASCDAAGAAVERARSAVDLARAQLDKMVLRAPFDAVIAELDTEVGEWITPSPPALPVPPVVDLLDPGSIYVSAPMDEVDSARFALGQEVRVSVDSFPGRHFAGKLTRIAPYVLDVEAQNRTIEIEVSLDTDTASKLLPGTSADVEVILERRDDVVRIPTQALLEGNRALVVGPDERLVGREIVVGVSNWDYTEVTGGLELGERVVLSLDRPEVQAGALVNVETEEGERAGAGPS
jgi:HlyD family secretion protein